MNIKISKLIVPILLAGCIVTLFIPLMKDLDKLTKHKPQTEEYVSKGETLVLEDEKYFVRITNDNTVTRVNGNVYDKDCNRLDISVYAFVNDSVSPETGRSIMMDAFDEIRKLVYSTTMDSFIREYIDYSEYYTNAFGKHCKILIGRVPGISEKLSDEYGKDISVEFYCR